MDVITVFCSKCGKEVNKGKYCNFCGAILQENVYSYENTKILMRSNIKAEDISRIERNLKYRQEKTTEKETKEPFTNDNSENSTNECIEKLSLKEEIDTSNNDDIQTSNKEQNVCETSYVEESFVCESEGIDALDNGEIEPLEDVDSDNTENISEEIVENIQIYNDDIQTTNEEENIYETPHVEESFTYEVAKIDILDNDEEESKDKNDEIEALEDINFDNIENVLEEIIDNIQIYNDDIETSNEEKIYETPYVEESFSYEPEEINVSDNEEIEVTEEIDTSNDIEVEVIEEFVASDEAETEVTEETDASYDDEIETTEEFVFENTENIPDEIIDNIQIYNDDIETSNEEKIYETPYVEESFSYEPEEINASDNDEAESKKADMENRKNTSVLYNEIDTMFGSPPTMNFTIQKKPEPIEEKSFFKRLFGKK